MKCPLCRVRPARRACPALGQQICAVCCGTKRLVEIACPADCVYLGAAQRHPPAATRRQQERDADVVMRALGTVSESHVHLFLYIHALIARMKPEGLSRMTDADVAEAAAALAATYETAARGLVYEHQATSVVADSLRRELQTRLAEVGKGGGSRFEREAAEVLRGIERGARHQVEGVGPGPDDYLVLVGRMLREPPPTAAAPPSIITP